MSYKKKSSGVVELVGISGLLGSACFLPFIFADDDCSNDPNTPPDQRCATNGSSGRVSYGGGGGNHTSGSERGGFGNTGRGFSLFS